MIDLFIFLGGVGFFLFGIRIMSEGLEKGIGEKMKTVVDKATSNIYYSTAIGFLVSASLHSSSATTVMAVGFVNAGILDLYGATGIIMGANIGTTLTGFMTALNLSAYAPLSVFVGSVLLCFFKKKTYTYSGCIFLGTGLLFLGMKMMSEAVKPLESSEIFLRLFSSSTNPVICILAGTVITCIIQSSTAGVGILQSLALQNLISVNTAVYIVYGQNIGTVITTLISSIGTSLNSKRTAFIHLYFNIIGTVLFLIITPITPFFEILKLFGENPAMQISGANLILNVVSTAVMLPFSKHFIRVSEKLLPSAVKSCK